MNEKFLLIIKASRHYKDGVFSLTQRATNTEVNMCLDAVPE